MWGRVPLPHTYVNIPMGCVHSAQKPYGLYCFPVSHNAQVPRGLRCSPVSHNAQVPRGLRCSPVSHNAQVPRGLRCSPVSHNAQVPRGLRCSPVSHNAKTPHGAAPIFPGYWNNTQKIPNMGLHRFRRGCGGWISGRRRLTAIKRAT